jgi:disulfide bond formation protein DsbB
VTRKTLCLLAGLGSLALLLGALAFQYWGGLAPCKLCIWQRWPHGIAAAAAALGLFALPALAALIGLLSVLTGAGIAFYHTGVERGWWPGPTSCSGGGDLSGLSGADLLSTEGAGAIVMCDEVAWEMLGLSMASWNGLASLGLAAVWVLALRAR